MNGIIVFFRDFGKDILDAFLGLGGIYPAMFLFITVSFLACLFLIDKTCRNIALSQILRDEYYEIRIKYKYDAKLATNNSIQLLRVNRYSFLSEMWLVLVKSFFGLVFAYGMAAELESGHVNVVFPFGINLLSLINLNVSLTLSVTLMVLITCTMQYYILSSVSRMSIVESSFVDIFGTSLVVLFCFIAPTGFVIFMDLFNFAEFSLLFYKVKTKKEENIKKYESAVRHLDFNETRRANKTSAQNSGKKKHK